MLRPAILNVASALALCLFSLLFLANFYAANVEHLLGVDRVEHYAWIFVSVAFALTLVLKAAFRKVAYWRFALALAVVAYGFTSYHEVGKHLGWKALTAPEAAHVLPWYGAALVLLGIAAFIVLRDRLAVWLMLGAGIAFWIPPLVHIVTHLPKTTQSTADGFVAAAETPAHPVDIYWIVLDGYPRADVLKEMFGFDNSEFLGRLKSAGFVVASHSYANFPATIYSISATLNMEYGVHEQDGHLMARPMPTAYPIVRGHSRTVAMLKAAGYRYVHFENGQDYLTSCGEGQEICVRGRTALDELDIAILGNTPVLDILLAYWPAKQISDSPFAWRAVDDVYGKLSVIQETPKPFFMYAHVIAPHPPIRLLRDCSTRQEEPDLRTWKAKEKGPFVEQLQCVNTQTLQVVDALTKSDPDAIIIIQSDHGTAFRQQFDPKTAKPAANWDADDLRERFSNFNAMRLPAGCKPLADSTSLIDTFPTVLSCVLGRTVPAPATRFFVTPYDNSPENGIAVEYPAPSTWTHNFAGVH
jgi:hypothetical protein